MHQRATKDILAGLIFIGFGLAFAATSATYQIGSTLSMGPGYFPLLLGGLLVMLGGVTAAKGWLAAEEGSIGPVNWKAIGLILGSILLFGLTVRGLGLAGSLFITVFLSALASHRSGVVLAAVIATGLTILCLLIFVVGLGLRLSVVGPWLGGVP